MQEPKEDLRNFDFQDIRSRRICENENTGSQPRGAETIQGRDHQNRRSTIMMQRFDHNEYQYTAILFS
jgi:hypothetical protein